MKTIKKLFDDIDLSWKKLIIFSIIIGVYVGLINSIPFLKNTSFTDIAVTLEWWILFGIIIIMNSKSKIDSALKCFVFFLISQPLIYLVEVIVRGLGWQVFSYYKFWGIVTIFTLPMGYIGYYLKKDKPVCLLILAPMIVLLTFIGIDYASMIYSYTFPRHLLTILFCLVLPYILVYGVFNNKKCKNIGYIICIISSIIMIGLTIYNISKGFRTYDTTFMYTSDEYPINEKWNVYLEDSKYGDVTIEKAEEEDAYYISAKFKKIGKTKLIIVNEEGQQEELELTINVNTYNLEY